MSNPFVFIVGCPRSGTTLLQRIVNAHPAIAITPETHWITRFFEKGKGLTPEGMVTRKLVSRLFEQTEIAHLNVGREQLLAMIPRDRPVSYASFVTSIFDSYGKAQGKAVVGDKTPGYIRSMNTLHSLWPEARFVHLIRDGRDVYLSTRHRPLNNPKPGIFDAWGEEPAATAALWWEINVRAGRTTAKSLDPGLYYEMRYESLVAHPREECSRLCDFLGFPFDEAMLRFHEDRARFDPGLDQNRVGLPVTPGLRDWQSQMPAEEVERFEATAGELLDELSYHRAVPRPGPEALERAARLRRALAQDPNTRD
jgi:sulfotransferase family protein